MHVALLKCDGLRMFFNESSGVWVPIPRTTLWLWYLTLSLALSKWNYLAVVIKCKLEVFDIG